MEKIKLKRILDMEELKSSLKKLEFRGLYGKDGQKIRPYDKAKFSIATVLPAPSIGDSPTIKIGNKKEFLFSPQPTLYQNQTDIIKTVDNFLKPHKIRINELKYGIEYDWKDRGTFHMIPPIIEKHSYHLSNGFIDLNKLITLFKKFYTKDSEGNLHHILNRFLENYFIDEISSINNLDIFHSNAPLINYGIQYNGKYDFYIICDGSHRIDYSIEHLNKPINVILVEPEENQKLIPYYAFPMPFRPTIRLSSKQAEIIYTRLERDKVHLFNDFLKKILHYDWTNTGLNVSRLRTNIKIN